MKLPIWVAAVVILFTPAELRPSTAQVGQKWASLDVSTQIEGIPGKWKKVRQNAAQTLSGDGVAVSTNLVPIEGEYLVRVEIYGQVAGEDGEGANFEIVWALEWRLDRGTHLRGMMREVESGYIPLEISDSKAAYNEVSNMVTKVTRKAAALIKRHAQELHDAETEGILNWAWYTSGESEA
jgi:hypothetical protein